jgi:hypothetical protein
MVASDTLVGLIGAGILLVALGGVFLFESQQVSASRDLEASSYNVQATRGDVDVRQGGTMVPNVGCVPPGSCPLRVWANVTLTNMPLIPSNASLHYVAWLTTGSNHLVMGQLAHADGEYRLDSGAKNRQAAYNRFLVTLETSAQPSTPSSITLYTKDVDTSSTGRKDVKGSHTAQVASGQGNVRLAEIDSSLRVTVELRGAENRTGLSYRVWLHDPLAAQGYRFAGNLTTDGDAVNGTAVFTVSGVRLGTWEHAFVTLEPSSAVPSREPASAPGGVIAFAATFREPVLNPV